MRALLACNILDTQAEACFDEITARAVNEFRVSTCAFGLIDSDRYWVKSSVGFGMQEVARSTSICANVVANNAPMVLEDTLKVRRFADHPFVTGSPFIRFYASFPVCTGEGYPVGAFCILDSSPRRFPWQEYLALKNYAKEVESELGNRNILRL